MKRRGFLFGLGAALAAPAIVRAEVIMPVRPLIFTGFDLAAGPDVTAVHYVLNGNVLMSADMVAKEALRLLRARYVFAPDGVMVGAKRNAEFFHG